MNRRQLKKNWLKIHRILTVCLIVLVIVHVLDVGIQLPTRLFNGKEENAYNQEQIKEQVNDAAEFSGAKLKDGIYEGAAEGYKGTIKVSVTVKEGLVTDIEILEENDTPEFFERAGQLLRIYWKDRH